MVIHGCLCYRLLACFLGYRIRDPLQDTPSVKTTYSAAVAVHAPLTALMSAQTVPSHSGEESATLPSSEPKLTDVSTGAVTHALNVAHFHRIDNHSPFWNSTARHACHPELQRFTYVPSLNAL